MLIMRVSTAAAAWLSTAQTTAASARDHTTDSIASFSQVRALRVIITIPPLPSDVSSFVVKLTLSVVLWL